MSIRLHKATQSPENRSGSLYIETWGRGDKTLVFLPGLGGTTRYWASRLAPLENDFCLVLVDLLGFGESPKPWKKYSVELHIDALHQCLKRFAPFTLIGHSLGAVIALAYTARYPQEVHSLALIGMPYFSSRDAAYTYYRHGPARGGWLLTNSILTMAVCIFTRRIMGRALPYLLRHVPREVAEDLVKHTWRSSTSSLWEVVYRNNIQLDLALIPVTTKVLFIHGDQDEMAPLRAVEHCAAKRKDWQITVFCDVDHHPFLRETAQCMELIRTLASGTNVPSKVSDSGTDPVLSCAAAEIQD